MIGPKFARVIYEPLDPDTNAGKQKITLYISSSEPADTVAVRIITENMSKPYAMTKIGEEKGVQIWELEHSFAEGIMWRYQVEFKATNSKGTTITTTTVR